MNCHYNSKSGYCSLQPLEKLSKKATIVRDTAKNTLEKETPVCNDHCLCSESLDVRRQVRWGWVQHWYSVAYVRESNGQISVHLDCNDR